MNDLTKVFACCTVSNSDSFVVDYSNDNDSRIAKRGVEITPDNPGYEYGAFHLINNNQDTSYYIVNFEHNPAFFTENGKKTRNCECMFTACYAKKKKWALLLEMKYCKEKNLEDNAADALDELEKTRDRLVKKGILNDEEYRLYFNISFPEHTRREPFLSFLFSQDELLAYYKQEKVNLMGYNRILIRNGAYLAPAILDETIHP